jgi:hypothetical protein
MSSPISKVQFCEYNGLGCFNGIRINCITGDYSYRDMVKAKEFTVYVNKMMY